VCRNVLSGRRQATLAIGVEMNRIDWGVIVVPCDEQRGSLHDEHGSSMGSPKGS
jgi:hypothetical protein